MWNGEEWFVSDYSDSIDHGSTSKSYRVAWRLHILEVYWLNCYRNRCRNVNSILIVGCILLRLIFVVRLKKGSKKVSVIWNLVVAAHGKDALVTIKALELIWFSLSTGSRSYSFFVSCFLFIIAKFLFIFLMKLSYFPLLKRCGTISDNNRAHKVMQTQNVGLQPRPVFMGINLKTY